MKLLLFTLMASASVAFALSPPSDLKATWSEGTDPNRTITLTWTDNSSDETGYIVERKLGAGTGIGATAWGDLTTTLGPGSNTYADTTIPRSVTSLTAYYYRVRAKGAGTTESAPAEVVTAGIPSAGTYDTDADGILDAAETAAGLQPLDWADGSADNDGDGIPNAWEVYKMLDMNVPNNSPTNNLKTATTVTVDPATVTDTNTQTKTITAALAKVSNGTNFPLNSYWIIAVKPGIYRENVTKSVVSNIAIVPLRESLADRFEIQGVHATNPIVSVTAGGFILDGFILSRASGTRGSAFKVTEAATPTNGISRVRLVNCLVSNMDTGTEALIVQDRNRLVVSHCTFYMNSADFGTLAHSYATGLLTALQSTARLKVHNSIFWNPTNVFIPEIQSVGEVRVTSSIFYRYDSSVTPPLPEEAESVNPGLTPTGYIAKLSSKAINGGTTYAIRVPRDIHGEIRRDPPSRGADEWDDFDNDGIPDFADSEPILSSNAQFDSDADSLSDLVEYLGSTNIYAADSPYLTLNQAYSLFMPQISSTSNLSYFTKAESYNLFYTRTQTFSRAESDSRYFMRIDGAVRVPPSGDIDMGDFTQGIQP